MGQTLSRGGDGPQNDGQGSALGRNRHDFTRERYYQQKMLEDKKKAEKAQGMGREWRVRNLRTHFKVYSKEIENLMSDIETLPDPVKTQFADAKREYQRLRNDFSDVFTLYGEDGPGSPEGVNLDQGRSPAELPDPSDHRQETFTNLDQLVERATHYPNNHFLNIVKQSARNANEDRLRDAVNQIHSFHQELNSQVQTEKLKVTRDQLQQECEDLTRQAGRQADTIATLERRVKAEESRHPKLKDLYCWHKDELCKIHAEAEQNADQQRHHLLEQAKQEIQQINDSYDRQISAITLHIPGFAQRTRANEFSNQNIVLIFEQVKLAIDVREQQLAIKAREREQPQTPSIQELKQDLDKLQQDLKQSENKYSTNYYKVLDHTVSAGDSKDALKLELDNELVRRRDKGLEIEREKSMQSIGKQQAEDERREVYPDFGGTPTDKILVNINLPNIQKEIDYRSGVKEYIIQEEYKLKESIETFNKNFAKKICQISSEVKEKDLNDLFEDLEESRKDGIQANKRFDYEQKVYIKQLMQIPLVGDLHDSLQQEVLKRGSEVELLNLAIIDGMNAKREKEVRLISDKLVEDLNDIIQQSSSIQRQETENLNKQLEQWQQIIEVEYDNDSKA